MSLQEMADVAQVGVGVGAIIASLAAAYFVYFGTKTMARLDYERSVRDAWMTVDNAVLEHEDLLTVADTLFNPTGSDDVPHQTRRKRWFAYMLLNPLSSGFYGLQHGLVDKQAMRNLEVMLRLILTDDDVYSLTQSGVHEPSFVEWCRALREAPAGIPLTPPPGRRWRFG